MVTILFKVAAIVLISSTEEISTVKPCHLKKVLEFLSVDNTSPCKYDDIKNDSTDIRNWGISLLVLSSIMFLLILNFTWILKNNIISIHFAVSTQKIFMVIYLCCCFFYQLTWMLCFVARYIFFIACRNICPLDFFYHVCRQNDRLLQRNTWLQRNTNGYGSYNFLITIHIFACKSVWCT